MLLRSVKRHCAEKMYTKCHTRYVFRLYRVFLALSTVTHFGSASPSSSISWPVQERQVRHLHLLTLSPAYRKHMLQCSSILWFCVADHQIKIAVIFVFCSLDPPSVASRAWGSYSMVTLLWSWASIPSCQRDTRSRLSMEEKQLLSRGMIISSDLSEVSLHGKCADNHFFNWCF
jgi:hypothetical protein